MSDPMKPDPRETKLPIWVQDTINRLRREVTDAQTEAEVARNEAGPADSNTVIERGFRADDIPLPTGSTIRFVLGDERRQQYVSARVSTEWVGRQERPVLLLMGGTMLHLVPQASNVVVVVTEDR